MTQYLPLLDALRAANKADREYSVAYTVAQAHADPEGMDAAAKAGNHIADIRSRLLEFFGQLT